MEIPILDDREREGMEEFFGQLTLVHSDADVQLVPDRTTIEITDNDGNYFTTPHSFFSL